MIESRMRLHLTSRERLRACWIESAACTFGSNRTIRLKPGSPQGAELPHSHPLAPRSQVVAPPRRELHGPRVVAAPGRPRGAPEARARPPISCWVAHPSMSARMMMHSPLFLLTVVVSPERQCAPDRPMVSPEK